MVLNICSYLVVLNIGSASQLSIINPSSTVFNISVYSALTEVPYFNNTKLLVAAALTGGNAIAKLVSFFREFLNGYVKDSLKQSFNS